MERFEWAERNLGARTPQELQSGRGVNVFFAPNIQSTKVVDLGSGRVDWFQPDEPRPEQRYFAGFATLERFCRREGLALVETDGVVSVLPHGQGEAGDPLRREGAEGRA